MDVKLEVGDVVQITAEDNRWQGCFIVVTEVKAWGIQGYIPSPQVEDVGLVFVRCETKDIEKVGVAACISA